MDGTGRFRIELGSGDPDWRSRRFVLHIHGPAAFKIQLKPEECRRRRVLATALIRSAGIRRLAHKTDYEVGKFHIARERGNAGWEWSLSSGFVSERDGRYRTIGKAWERIFVATDSLVGEDVTGINVFTGIQNTRGELWIDDLVVLVY